ncbi:zinc finger CCCH domain-containing protein 3 [Episyrphus balteatus]|uniref:zinc finger CCCH domain-containing protein 3 n=1 Tax=Episyrphus balteatus TaxID=286459 RepID=UPI00248513B2|nr:zinc finger CCCH domain-containing protein 3 [Episyrphus balteatus]
MFPIDNTTSSSSRTIFINPNFNKLPPTHINPKFLRPQLNPSIHVNPNFLAKKTIQQTNQLEIQPIIPIPAVLPPPPPTSSKHQLLRHNATVLPSVPLLPNKIISKSRTKIVRVPMNVTPINSTTTTTNTTVKKSIPLSSPGLVKIGLRKLIRPTTTVATVSVKPKPVTLPSGAPQAKYKIDRRILTTSIPIRKRKTSFTGRYALRRSSDSLSKKVISRFIKRNTDVLKFSKMPFKATSIVSKNRQILNINGVLYKSTRNKLERKDAPKVVRPVNAPTPKKPTRERAIFVRGTKYLLDKSGFNLTRVATTKPSTTPMKSLRRIDIGGLTYIANSKNVLVRTDTHLTRNHVSNAKQKSIHLLSRRFVKTNIPCPIFQRVGKCASFDRGKCMKVHDKLHIAICPRFLRGECLNSSCLLSHNISLSKMPVCKFFLQGCCVREDCPYLHKKLSAKAEICVDFLKGFCKLAQKCNKRHEFVCPDMEAKGKCEKVKCSYCRKQQMSLNNKKEVHQKKTITSSGKSKSSSVEEPTSSKSFIEISDEPSLGARYFAAAKDTIELGEIRKVSEINESVGSDDDGSDSDDNEINEEVITASSSSVPKRARPQLGELPAFIPFS